MCKPSERSCGSVEKTQLLFYNSFLYWRDLASFHTNPITKEQWGSFERMQGSLRTSCGSFEKCGALLIFSKRSCSILKIRSDAGVLLREYGALLTFERIWSSFERMRGSFDRLQGSFERIYGSFEENLHLYILIPNPNDN